MKLASLLTDREVFSPRTKGVRAVYNKAEYAEQRRDMLQQWANMVDGWIEKRRVKLRGLFFCA